MHGIPEGHVDLPARGIKDAEGVGLCTQVCVQYRACRSICCSQRSYDYVIALRGMVLIDKMHIRVRFSMCAALSLRPLRLPSLCLKNLPQLLTRVQLPVSCSRPAIISTFLQTTCTGSRTILHLCRCGCRSQSSNRSASNMETRTRTRTRTSETRTRDCVWLVRVRT